jgi:hypothetical protein
MRDWVLCVLDEAARRHLEPATHYEAVLQAIAKGLYPGDQAALAAQHALDSQKGRG